MGEDGKINLNEYERCKKHRHLAKRWLVLVSFILFLFNIWKNLNTPGAEIPILSLLFNIAVYLGIIMFIIYKNEIVLDY